MADEQQQIPAFDPEGVLRGKHLSPLVKSLVQEIGRHVAQQLLPLVQRIEALEQRAGKAASVKVDIPIEVPPGQRMQ